MIDAIRSTLFSHVRTMALRIERNVEPDRPRESINAVLRISDALKAMPIEGFRLKAIAEPSEDIIRESDGSRIMNAVYTFSLSGETGLKSVDAAETRLGLEILARVSGTFDIFLSQEHPITAITLSFLASPIFTGLRDEKKCNITVGIRIEGNFHHDNR